MIYLQNIAHNYEMEEKETIVLKKYAKHLKKCGTHLQSYIPSQHYAKPFCFNYSWKFVGVCLYKVFTQEVNIFTYFLSDTFNYIRVCSLTGLSIFFDLHQLFLVLFLRASCFQCVFAPAHMTQRTALSAQYVIKCCRNLIIAMHLCQMCCSRETLKTRDRVS